MCYNKLFAQTRKRVCNHMSSCQIQDLNMEDLEQEKRQEGLNDTKEVNEQVKNAKKSKKKKKANNEPSQQKKAGGKGKTSGKSLLVKRLAEAQQEHERLKREEEEKERLEEELRQKEFEKQRLEEEKKQREKQKRKERKLKQKQEGKLLSKSQQKRKTKNQENIKRMIDSGTAFLGHKIELEPRSDSPVREDPIVTCQTTLKLDQSSDSEETSPNQLNDNIEKISQSLENTEITQKAIIFDPIERIKHRKCEVSEDASLNLRAPIICVMGHVDTGKTKILDKLRNTKVQAGEAGGITQQIGMTNVPLSAVKDSVAFCPYMKDFVFKLDGLAIIDTPGHFSFRNLRSLGSSLCDMAILIVDIMHSIEPQTVESIKLLVAKKTPFVVALNKIDLVTGWISQPNIDIQSLLSIQTTNTQRYFDDLYRKTFTKFAELGFNLALAWNAPLEGEFISAIPTSAKTGDGIGDLISFICKYSQDHLEKRLTKTKELRATIMDVKVILGLGPTIDVVLADGILHRGDKIIVPGVDGPIVSQIRALITPQPLKEMRVKGQDEQHETISACHGVRIAGSNLENAIAGLPMFVAQYDDEVDHYTSELNNLMTKTFSMFQKKDKGVYVHASTLGSLEALLDFLKDSNIPFFGYSIGPVHKKSVITAMSMLDHNPMYAVILAFDVKIEPDAQAFAQKSGVKIFTADIIYHLYNQYMAYEKQKADEHRNQVIFPCSLKILPNHVFKSRDPIIVGVRVEDGTVRVGTPLCVPTRNNTILGIIGSMEINHKPVEIAKKGQELCIRIANYGEEAPKMVGRHFEITDQIISKLTRDSIDVLKDYFRDEMTKQDWLLVKELKTLLGIT